MIYRLSVMSVVTRAASSLLLAGGVALVFVGLSAALGSGVVGAVASIAVIATLLYAGGVWFGGAPAPLAPGAEAVIIFDRSLRVTAGAVPGTALLSRFPPPLRPELEMRCRLALQGEHTHFDCEHAGAHISFDISPVQSIQGVVLYGALITSSGIPVSEAAGAPLLIEH